MSDDKSPKNGIDLKKYEDPTGLAAKNLDFGLWLANNRKRLTKLLIIILALLAAGSVIYSVYGYIYYFVFGQEQEKIITGDTSGVNLAEYRLQNTPVDLQVSQVRVINTNTGADYVALVKNTNEKQFASFDYCFKTGVADICGAGFILPSEEKNIVSLNSPTKSLSGSANIELKNVRWQKLNAGQIPNWVSFKAERIKFNITEPKFSSYDGNVKYLEFDITNESAYGYFEVPLNILIKNGDTVVAVNRYVVNGLSSREKKSIRLAWSEVSNLSGTISVVPDIDILNTNVFKPYTSN